MNDFYQDFIRKLYEADREACLEAVLHELEEGNLSVAALYTNVLTPALNSIGNENQPQSISIWKEHLISSIIRTIIECCHPYVIKERKKSGIEKKGKKAVVVCPDGEHHELGARMAADFFVLAGYDTIFIGSSTPKKEFLDVMDIINPSIIAISVTNYFNLVAAKKIIQGIKAKNTSDTMKIVVGGHAFARNPDAVKEVGADLHINGFADISSLGDIPQQG